MKQAILDTLSEWLMNGAAAALRVLVRAEKAVFFRTGRRGRVLVWYWRESGARLQRELNRQHRTAIRYGQIQG